MENEAFGMWLVQTSKLDDWMWRSYCSFNPSFHNSINLLFQTKLSYDRLSYNMWMKVLYNELINCWLYFRHYNYFLLSTSKRLLPKLHSNSKINPIKKNMWHTCMRDGPIFQQLLIFRQIFEVHLNPITWKKQKLHWVQKGAYDKLIDQLLHQLIGSL